MRCTSSGRARVQLVAGARPNYMKVAPIHWAIGEHAPGLDVEMLHTGQHYDASMSDAFFRELHLPNPDVNLRVGSGSHAAQTARIMMAYESVLLDRQPDVIVVVGDVNSSVACALVAAKIVYPRSARRERPVLVHVEAGLRSRDRTMPEEVNRVVTDTISDCLFTTCRDADANLVAEGIDARRIRFVGNPMIDSLYRCLEDAEGSSLLEELGVEAGTFGLVTLHRPSNVDCPEVLEGILDALGEIAREFPMLIPLHPRTRQRIEEFGLQERIAFVTRPVGRAPARGLVALEPLSYLEMLKAMKSARVVLTDSGGIQEETTALGVPCVTLRNNTERPVTIEEGTNVLAGVTREGILAGFVEAERKTRCGARVPELWDGRAAERIVAALTEIAEVE
jgi:UDP-N-acetylglucosamine 2-epimerase (non-hydrolysing)